MVPVLARVGDVTLYTHDVFSVLAIGVGFGIYYWELRRRGWLEARIVWISLAALLGAAVGARLITSWERPDVYASFTSLPLLVAIEQSGKSLIRSEERRVGKECRL